MFKVKQGIGDKTFMSFVWFEMAINRKQTIQILKPRLFLHKNYKPNKQKSKTSLVIYPFLYTFFKLNFIIMTCRDAGSELH